MCMQCVAQSTPMIAVGMTVLRRRTLAAWIKHKVHHFGGLRGRRLPADLGEHARAADASDTR